MTMNTTTTNTTTTMYPYQWNPGSIHPCNIIQMNEIEFETKFGPNGLPPLYPSPIVITHNTVSSSSASTASSTKTSSTTTTTQQQQQKQKQQLNNKQQQRLKFQKMTQSDTILNQFSSNYQITLSSSNSFSEHRKTIPFSQYLNDVLYGNDILPNQLSNETWYLFGETYDDEWTKLLQNYQLPNCVTCKYPNLVALSFGIGNRGSGVQWHVHGPGFSESIHGRKHWILSPNKPNFHPDQTSLNWMEYTYTNITKTKTATSTKQKKKQQQIMVEEGGKNDDADDADAERQHSTDNTYYECTLYPGDIIYFPDMWWHATINLDTYTAFVSTFTQEHKLVLNDDDDDSSSSWEL